MRMIHLHSFNLKGLPCVLVVSHTKEEIFNTDIFVLPTFVWSLNISLYHNNFVLAGDFFKRLTYLLILEKQCLHRAYM